MRVFAPLVRLQIERLRAKRLLSLTPAILLVVDGLRIYPDPYEIYNNPNWLDMYIDIERVDRIIISSRTNAWIRAGRQLESLQWLVEVYSRRYYPLEEE
jgi:hypothetical protein